MKKVLKKGFTLIELMVVIAIIGILATTLAPKLREQLARAKDSKAVSFLGASRTVASSLIISHMTGDSDGKEGIEISWDKMKSQMDVTTKGLLDNSELIIGGSRESKNGKLIYGGSVSFGKLEKASTFDRITLNTKSSNPGGEIKDASDLHLFKLKKGATNTSLKNSMFSTEGKNWSAY